MKHRKTKKNYVAPSIKLKIIYLEDSFASASTTTRILPGNADTPYTPEVFEWTEKGNTDGSFEF